MNIETKYSVGDTCYYITREGIVPFVIKSLTYTFNNLNIEIITYRCEYFEIEEKYLFATKQDALNFILENFNKIE